MVVLLPLLCLEVFPRAPAPAPVSLLNAFIGVLLMYRLYAVLRYEFDKRQQEDQAAAAAS
uniref:Uncharacterized protein n=1 Tax=Oryza punctata TaxID=4537 RepID=A0A0E0LI40_ORYPU